MKKERLLELAGVQINEAKTFTPKIVIKNDEEAKELFFKFLDKGNKLKAGHVAVAADWTSAKEKRMLDEWYRTH